MLTSLISNIRRLTSQTKQSYFCKTWGNETGFAKQIDRSAYRFDEADGGAPSSMLNKHLLSRYEQRDLPPEFRRFVSNLCGETISHVARQKGLQLAQVRRIATINSSAIALINRIFNYLELCRLETNGSLGLNEMTIVSTEPQMVTEVLSFTKSRQPEKTVSYYRTRFATSNLALIIRAKDGIVECFLLPIEVVMGLSKSEQVYHPIATIEAEYDHSGSVEWNIQGVPLNAYRTHSLCMVLFKQLVKRSMYKIAESPMHSLSNAPVDDDTPAHPFLAYQAQSSAASSSRGDGVGSSAAFLAARGGETAGT